MTTITARAGEVLNLEYPPRHLVADVHRGVVTILKLDHPDETLADLKKAAVNMRRNRRRAETLDETASL